MSSYFSFLDYLAIRRNIESRASKLNLLVPHITLFLINVIMALRDAAYSPYQYPYQSTHFYFLPPNIGFVFLVWAFIIALHGVFTYRRSTQNEIKREQLIEDEMRKQIELHEEASDYDLFNLHQILDRDLKRRSGKFKIITIFTVVNSLMWIIWFLISNGRDSFAWQVTIILTAIFIVLIGLQQFFNGAESTEKLLKRFPAPQQHEKPRRRKEQVKRKNDYQNEYDVIEEYDGDDYSLISDDGEIVPMRKRKS